MSIPYDLFIAGFLNKVTEYDFIGLADEDRNNIVDGYMKLACAQFNRVCKYDLANRDDIERVFNIDIPDEEIDEVIDIVSEGMLVQWMKPYVYRAENLENVLNTADFSAYSPAELLYRIGNAYNSAKRDFTNMMRAYSYNHGDLSDLSL